MRLGWEEIDCIFVDMDDVDLPVMTPDLDIFRSAQVLVEHRGEDAPIHMRSCAKSAAARF